MWTSPSTTGVKQNKKHRCMHLSVANNNRTISTKDPASELAAYIITTTWALAFSSLFGLVLAIEVVLSKSSQSEGVLCLFSGNGGSGLLSPP